MKREETIALELLKVIDTIVDGNHKIMAETDNQDIKNVLIAQNIVIESMLDEVIK